MTVECPHGTPRPSTASSPTTPGSRPTRSRRSATGSPPARPRETRPTCPPPPRFVEGWQIPRPDLVLEMPREIEIPAEGSMPYQLVEIDPKITHDVWVRASQVRPGNPAVVHHVVVFVLPPGVEKIDEAGGDFLAAYAPGMPARVMPDGVAKRIPAGSKIVLQLHYTPRGTKQVDRSRIGLVFAEPAKVDKELMSGMALNFRLQIPPGSRDYVSRADFRFSQPSLLLSLLPHMHLRGKSMTFVAEYPDGRREVDPRRSPLRVRLAEPLRPRPAQADARGDDPPHRGPLRQLGRQSRTTRTRGAPSPSASRRGMRCTSATSTSPSPTRTSPSACPPRSASRTASTRSPSVTALAASATSVALVGTFTDWKERPLAMTGPDAQGNYSTTIVLDPGSHEYKFLIDGEAFRQDPGQPRIGRLLPQQPDSAALSRPDRIGPSSVVPERRDRVDHRSAPGRVERRDDRHADGEHDDRHGDPGREGEDRAREVDLHVAVDHRADPRVARERDRPGQEQAEQPRRSGRSGPPR